MKWLFLLICLLVVAIALSGCLGSNCGNNVCEAGESPTDCPQDCPIEAHFECSGQECVEVIGAGANQCQTDSDCQAPPMCGNGAIEGDEECDGIGCKDFEACNESCTCDFRAENKMFEGDGTYEILGGDSIKTDFGFIFRLEEYDSGDQLIIYSILDSAEQEIPGWSSLFAPVELGKEAGLKIFQWEYPIQDGVINYTIKSVEELQQPVIKLEIESCMQSTYLRAKGQRKILFVPAYFKDVEDEISNHTKRVPIYEDAFDEINEFIKVKQNTHLGKQLLSFSFTLTEAILLSNPSAGYYDGPISGDEKNKRVYQEIRNSTSLEPLDFDVIVFNMYSREQTTSASHSEKHVAFISPKSPEAVTGSETPGQTHGMRNSYTSGALHEILHQFGMTDAHERPGQNYHHEYYVGDKYDGSQELLYDDFPTEEYERTNGNAGDFQAIDDFIASEFGWSDRNDNGITDLEEYCETHK